MRRCSHQTSPAELACIGKLFAALFPYDSTERKRCKVWTVTGLTFLMICSMILLITTSRAASVNPKNLVLARRDWAMSRHVSIVRNNDSEWHFGWSRLVPEIPSAFSLPHFYKSDKSLLEEYIGLEPDENKHRSFFVLSRVSRIINPIVEKASYMLEFAASWSSTQGQSSAPVQLIKRRSPLLRWNRKIQLQGAPAGMDWMCEYCSYHIGTQL